MVTVYAIISLVNGMIYVGMAVDPDKRLLQHNAGKSKFTKGYKPWKMFYSEQAADWKAGRCREKYLKSGAGKEFLRSLIKND